MAISVLAIVGGLALRETSRISLMADNSDAREPKHTPNGATVMR
jgi:hypothetical protein